MCQQNNQSHKLLGSEHLLDRIKRSLFGTLCGKKRALRAFDELTLTPIMSSVLSLCHAALPTEEDGAIVMTDIESKDKTKI